MSDVSSSTLSVLPGFSSCGYGYIDTHFHILPGVDDGAKNIEIALQMARLALQDGVRVIVATPHPDNTSGIGSYEITFKEVEKFQACLQDNGITDLKVLPGAECYLSPELLTQLKQRQLLPLNNSQYVLIEMNYLSAPVNVEQVMYQLRSAGYIPIIAHPERYNYVQADPEWLARLIRLGCLAQVTSGAFYGGFGKRGQKAAETLLRLNLVHVIASDAHNTQVRKPGLSPARPVVEEIAGAAKFRQMAFEVPTEIINNRFFEPEMPEPVQSKPFWKFW